MPSPDEAGSPATSETPTADALSGGSVAPAVEAVPAADGEGAAAAATPETEEATKAREATEYEDRRKKARQELLPEHQAIRDAKRQLRQEMQAFQQTQAQYNQRIAELEAEAAEAAANPFAFAAKKRGVDEAEVYNERTLRAVDPTAAELERMKKELDGIKEEKKREQETEKARQAQQYAHHVQRKFAEEVIQLATSEKEFRMIQLGMEEGEYRPENVGREALTRVWQHYGRTRDETGEGEILDPREVLKTIESELREEAKRKAARQAKLEAAQAAIPDREGAVKAAAHEAVTNPGPRTLTNAHASQPSASQRPMTRRERMLEAEKRLRGG